MSAPELSLAHCRADILEIAAFGARAAEAVQRASARGWSLSPLGRAAQAGDGFALAVRPERWLLLLPPAAAGVHRAAWQEQCADSAAVVELSAGLAALFLVGPAVREVLRRGCRLDLDPEAFPTGAAAATSMAQVAVTLAALPGGLLLLTPASTALHFEEWLGGAARAFGMAHAGDVTVADMRGPRSS